MTSLHTRLLAFVATLVASAVGMAALAGPISGYPPATTPYSGLETVAGTQSGNTVTFPLSSLGGYSAQLIHGDCAVSASNVITCTKTNGVNLGSAATVNTGTSGATIPLLSTANTWNLLQTFSSGISTTSITGMTTPLSVGQGGTGNTSNAAASLSPGATISLSGDVSATGGTFTGASAYTIGSTTLATVNSNVGTCGDGAHVPQVTLDAKGRATACTPVNITAGVTFAAASDVAAGTSTTLAVNPSALAGNEYTTAAVPSIAAASHGTLSYTLPVAAVRIVPYLVCTSAVHSYGTGDIIPIGAQGSPGGSAGNFGTAAWVISSNTLGYVIGSSGIAILDGTSGNQFIATDANFQLYFRVYSY